MYKVLFKSITKNYKPNNKKTKDLNKDLLQKKLITNITIKITRITNYNSKVHSQNSDLIQISNYFDSKDHSRNLDLILAGSGIKYKTLFKIINPTEKARLMSKFKSTFSTSEIFSPSLVNLSMR